MNVLVSCGVFHPRKGGAESLFFDLARVVAARGHNVTILTRLFEDTEPFELIDGFHIMRFDWPVAYEALHLNRRFLLGSPRALWQTHKLLRSERISTVCVGLLDMSVMYLLALRPLMQFRLITYLHGAEIRDLPRESRSFRWLAARCLDASDAVVAVSPSLAEHAIGAHPAVRKKLTVIPNGIDVHELAAAPANARERAYILYLGRLAREKNAAVILKAYARAAPDIPTVDLLIAGSGPERETLLALAHTLGLDRRIEFVGDVERTRAFGLIKGASCLLLASDAESHPLVAIEALAAGKIVIGPRVAGMTDLIDDGVNGVLYPGADIGALCALMVRYAGDAAARMALEERISQTDRTCYDIGALADEHLRVWQPPR